VNWAGPHEISAYLGSVTQLPSKRPPEAPGVYIVAEKPWRDWPADADGILCVGQAASLRYQIGRLMCDLLGFTSDNPSAEEAYQHKGGHSLWSHYCLPNQIEPVRLYLGWCSECLCLNCAETKLLEMITTGPRRVRICASHRPPLDLRLNRRIVMPAQKNSAGSRHH